MEANKRRKKKVRPASGGKELDYPTCSLDEIKTHNECSEHHRLSDNPLLKNEKCDEMCKAHCVEWLIKNIGGE